VTRAVPRFLKDSIRVRLILGATLVLVAFVAAAGWAVQRAHAESVRAAHFAQLQSTVYLLLAGAELDARGALVMPATFPEPRLLLPGSGLFASVFNPARNEQWRSPSTVTSSPPFQRRVAVGQWRYETLGGNGGAGVPIAPPRQDRQHPPAGTAEAIAGGLAIAGPPQDRLPPQGGVGEAGTGGQFLAVSYGVNWTEGGRTVPLVLSVLEDRALFDREVAVFDRTLWSWLGGAGLLLLLSQALLLQWGLAPLRRVAQEIMRIERGAQSEVVQRYPTEIAALTDNLNTLMRQQRARQTRYKDGLSFLAHSLKTPLAVLRGTLDEPDRLRITVAEQVARMDAIVQHQLGRAGASGAARFARFVRLKPIVLRIFDALTKVHANKQEGLDFGLDCPDDLEWRIDEGDAFEVLGNTIDNAAKWAVRRVGVRLARDARGLTIQIDDDGPGFRGDTQAVLQLHVRADEQVPGHGVGLAVVHDLVTSHHGSLALSRSDWGGGRVEIVLSTP